MEKNKINELSKTITMLEQERKKIEEESRKLEEKLDYTKKILKTALLDNNQLKTLMKEKINIENLKKDPIYQTLKKEKYTKTTHQIEQDGFTRQQYRFFSYYYDISINTNKLNPLEQELKRQYQNNTYNKV